MTPSQASLRDLKTKLLHVHVACTKQPLNKVKISYNTVYTGVLLISKYISKIYSSLSYVILEVTTCAILFLLYDTNSWITCIWYN